MDNTSHLALPLLDAAQSQKHVTVNEALIRLDASVGGRVVRIDVNEPPTSASDGDVFATGPAPIGVWLGRPRELALWTNGGWEFLPMPFGRQLWVEDEGVMAVFDGAAWRRQIIARRRTGAATIGDLVEVTHSIAPGATSVIPNIIPGKSIVLGVSARIIEAVAGATTWSLGTADSATRYGSGYGIAQGSFALGLTSSPLTYFDTTSLVLTSAGGAFTRGVISVAIHLFRIEPPKAS